MCDPTEMASADSNGDAPEMTEEELQQLYRWIDAIPLSRPKRNIARDFSDGVLMSEVVKHFFPRMVDLHNYIKAEAFDKKKPNWKLLNHKVFRKMGFQLSEPDIDAVCNCERGSIERVLQFVQKQMAAYEERRAKSPKDANSTDEEAPRHPIISPGHNKKSPSLSSLTSPRYSGGGGGGGGGGAPAVGGKDLLAEKDKAIKELSETVQILQLKVNKLEHLIKLKDEQIETLTKKAQEAASANGKS